MSHNSTYDPYYAIGRKDRSIKRLALIILILLVICVLLSARIRSLQHSEVISDTSLNGVHSVTFAYRDTVVVDGMDDRRYHMLMDSIATY